MTLAIPSTHLDESISIFDQTKPETMYLFEGTCLYIYTHIILTKCIEETYSIYKCLYVYIYIYVYIYVCMIT